MEPDCDVMRRAISKEFHARGGHYVFGKSKPFEDWWQEKEAGFARERAARIAAAAAAAAVAAAGIVAAAAAGIPTVGGAVVSGGGKPFLVPLLRGDCGSRQDIGVEASWGSFHNRPVYVEFLHYVIDEWKVKGNGGGDKATILDNSLFVQLTSPLMIAADMVRATLFDKCFRPLRILCNGVDLPNWHPLEMATVADKLEGVFEAVLADPRSILDEEFECFPVAEFPVLEQKVKQWGECEEIKSIRRELYHPTDETVIDAKVGCEEIVTAWATGILASLRRNCKDYLTSSNGRYAKGNQTTRRRR
jgi:hypothetical protein